MPYNIFVSYSPVDKDYLTGLIAALSGLRRRNLINTWYDGKIIPGQDIDKEIEKQLIKSDIILLLLSTDYVDSDCCWDKQLGIARELHKERNTKVVGVLIRTFNYEQLEFSKNQLLPNDGIPVQKWPIIDDAWKNVCEGIEQVINDINNSSQVDDALEVSRKIMASGSAAQVAQTPHLFIDQVYPIESVSLFWEQRGENVRPGNMVTIQGTFSQYAPMLMGSPKAKLRLHKFFRQALEKHPALRNRKGETLDACMSVSSGQMVWRIQDDQSPHIYFGLYNSIVRNSIPVFVARDYYENELLPLFKKHNQRTFEAIITGRVIELNNSPTKQFLNKHAKSFISKSVTDELCTDVYGILIDGKHSSIERQSNPRYLDGDIWIAVDINGNERFLTSFLNISDPEQRSEELNALLNEAKKMSGTPRIIAQFDQAQHLNGEDKPVSDKNGFLDSIWRFGFGL